MSPCRDELESRKGTMRNEAGVGRRLCDWISLHYLRRDVNRSMSTPYTPTPPLLLPADPSHRHGLHYRGLRPHDLDWQMPMQTCLIIYHIFTTRHKSHDIVAPVNFDFRCTIAELLAIFKTLTVIWAICVANAQRTQCLYFHLIIHAWNWLNYVKVDPRHNFRVLLHLTGSNYLSYISYSVIIADFKMQLYLTLLHALPSHSGIA